MKCKFEVFSITQRKDVSGKPVYDIEMQAVTSGSIENKEYWKYTPTGNLKIRSHLLYL